MDSKQKLLEALCITFDDLSESRLLDILVDAYKAKKKRIAQLEAENAHERETLRAEREALLSERRQMRSDPLYCATGDYFFECNGHRFAVQVHGAHVQMFERARNGLDFAGRPMSLMEFES